MVGSSLTRQKLAWLQAREELRQAQIVTVKQGLSLTPSLYFGTRRCTYSTVVSVVTTALPLPRYDPLDQQVSSINEKDTLSNDASRWAEERAREALTRLKQVDDNQNGESENDHQQRAFMKSLHEARRERARREYEAALVIQRVRRGFVLRRQFRGIRQKLLVRKRIRGSLLQVTKGTALVLGEKDRRLKMLAKHNNAAVKIQSAFKEWGARRLLAKLRALNHHEQRQRYASIIQNVWRASTARWVATKLQLQREQARRLALARLMARLFVGFQARCRVRALRLQREHRAAFKLQSFIQCRLLASKSLNQARTRTAQERGHSGAAGMQTLVRGMLQRAYVAKMRRAEELADANEHEDEACNVLMNEAGSAQRMSRVSREGSSEDSKLLEADLLVQARRGNVDTVVDLLDGFDPSVMGREDGVDEDLLAVQLTRVSVPGGNHVLHLAAKFGHLEVVTLVLPRLLNSAPEVVYARNAKGFTALALAVINGHERVAIYMLAMTSRLFMDHVLPGRRRTLLHEAARRGLGTVVAKLLQLFPQIFTGAEQDAWTQRTAIHEALLVGIEVVQDGQVFPWSRHQAHAHRIAYSPDEEADHAMAVLETLLAKAPHAPLEAKDFLGFTPLHIAAARGNLRAVTRLLAFGADVSVKDVHDRTAWRVALLRGHDACFQEIRRKWLHDVVSNNAGQKGGASGAANVSTARTVVTPAGSTSMALHPQLELELFAACKRGDVAKMRFYIDECEVSVNAVEEVESNPNADDAAVLSPFRPLGRSLLMVACEHRQLRAVQFLLAKTDLNVNYTADDGRSALTIAQASLAKLQACTRAVY
ncbi:hypothetical protein PInf_015040 [Phytophthora infestans]|nr:hypothetical protein PInf_015040 [Phytophthora infestans]